MKAQDIILKPLLSEKSYEGITNKIYTFVVHKSANKTEIKMAVEELFEVKVDNVRGILNRIGQNQGMTPSLK